MGSTFASIHVHIVFATKGRREIILPEWRPRLHAYAGGVIRGVNGVPEAVGGVADHMHILAGIRPVMSVADTVRELKKQTTAWVRDEFDSRFGWQEGYAVFSVGATGLESVKKYIAGQEEHHKTRSFKYELRSFLEEAGIPFEERFLD